MAGDVVQKDDEDSCAEGINTARFSKRLDDRRSRGEDECEARESMNERGRN